MFYVDAGPYRERAGAAARLFEQYTADLERLTANEDAITGRQAELREQLRPRDHAVAAE